MRGRDSNALRLAAVERRKAEAAGRTNAVTRALRAIDASIPSASKILFRDSSPLPKRRKTSTSNTKPKHQLFGDGDEGDEDEAKAAFSQPQFEGRDGQELFRIQTERGGDSRFRMDSRFAEEEQAEEPPVDEDAHARRLERQSQFNVLAKVLGKTVSASREGTTAAVETGKERSGVGKRPMVRFDPSNPQHSKFVKTVDEAEDVSGDFEEEEKQAKADKAEVVVETTVEERKVLTNKPGVRMSADFVQVPRAKAEEATPLSGDKVKLVEDAGDSQERKSSNTAVEDSATKESRKVEHKRSRFLDDGFKPFSEDAPQDDEQSAETLPTKKERKKKRKEEKAMADAVGKQKERFFFSADDERFAAARFYRTTSLKLVEKTWAKFRPSLINSYKKQRKAALGAMRASQRTGAPKNQTRTTT